jgi:poly(glycerol-phosphate) alpha-glucosyltransferase
MRAGSEKAVSPSIAFLTASLSARAGGLAASVPATVAALGEAGASVTLAGLRDDAYDEASLPGTPSRIEAVPSWPTPGIRLAPALDRAVSDADCDLLHLQGLWLYPSIATLRWRRRTGRPVVISPHGMLDPWAVANAGWKKRLALAAFERANLRGAACIHALNAGERDAMRSFGLTGPVAVIPNGVTLPEAGRAPPRPGWLPADRRVLLFLGRIHPKKGLSETLEAWAKLPDGLRDRWALVLAGWDDGGHLEGLRRQAAALGLREGVLFPGPVFGADKAALLAYADAFILASHSEGLPMGVLEAWAHRLPVFMTRACNLPEGFEDGAAVEIPTEPEGLARILAARLEEPSLPAMGEAGRSLVEARFTWDSVARDLLAVYRWVLGRGPKPACVET